MLELFVPLQIGLVFCGIFTLVTRILHVFVLVLPVCFQVTIVGSFIFTQHTVIGNSFVLRLLVHCQMTLVSCFIVTLVAEVADTLVHRLFVDQESLRSAIVSSALPTPVVLSYPSFMRIRN